MSLSASSKKALYDAIREIKGASLVQPEVDAIERILEGSAGSIDLKASPRAIAFIHGFEKLVLEAYKDPGSKNGLPITIGWGTTVDEDGKPISLGATWTRAKADRLFARDFAITEAAVVQLVRPRATNQAQFDAMVSLAYNIGVGAFAGSTLLRKHVAGDFAGAAAEFKRWNKNDGKVMAGLTRRRAGERAIYEGKA